MAGTSNRRSAPPRSQPMIPPLPGWLALTGTPGTGKTSARTRLPPRLGAREVGDLAAELGSGRRSRSGAVVVDLPALRRAFRSYARAHPRGILVGHLAHLLPVSYSIVLRCHPRELSRRLRKAKRTANDRAANVLSEILDVVLVEALGTGAPVRELDVSRLSPDQVARVVTRWARRRPAARYGRINWMADPRVTEEFLRGAL